LYSTFVATVATIVLHGPTTSTYMYVYVIVTRRHLAWIDCRYFACSPPPTLNSIGKLIVSVIY